MEVLFSLFEDKLIMGFFFLSQDSSNTRRTYTHTLYMDGIFPFSLVRTHSHQLLLHTYEEYTNTLVLHYTTRRDGMVWYVIQPTTNCPWSCALFNCSVLAQTKSVATTTFSTKPFRTFSSSSQLLPNAQTHFTLLLLLFYFIRSKSCYTLVNWPPRIPVFRILQTNTDK